MCVSCRPFQCKKSNCHCWSRFSIGVYGSKTVFSLPFGQYCSNLLAVSENLFLLWVQNTSHGPYAFAKTYNHRGGGNPLFPHRLQKLSGTSISVFYVRSATSESVVISGPASSIYLISIALRQSINQTF